MIKLLLVEDDANLCYIIRGGLEDMIGGQFEDHLYVLPLPCTLVEYTVE